MSHVSDAAASSLCGACKDKIDEDDARVVRDKSGNWFHATCFAASPDASARSAAGTAAGLAAPDFPPICLGYGDVPAKVVFRQ